MPTPSQINQAMQNHRQPPRTHGAMLRDALAHVRQSRNEKTACGGGSLDIGQMTSQMVTNE